MRRDEELDALISAFSVDIPAADPQRKEDNIALAKKNYETHQRNAEQVRPMVKASEKRKWFEQMEHNMTTFKAALFGTSGLIAAGAAMVFIIPVVTMQQVDFKAPAESEISVLGDQDQETYAKQAPKMGVLSSRAGSAMDEGLVQMQPTSPPLMAMPAQDARSVSSMAVAPPNLDFGVKPGPGDRFEDVDASGVKIVAEEPVSTFSIDVDTASYATVRSYLKQGQIPPADAVRIEEMINYFPYSYAGPDEGGAPFQTHVATVETPWNPDTKLVHIGIQGMMPEVEERPALDLVFLIDTSGSMRGPDRLGLLKTSLKMMLPSLRPEDRVGIVTYAGSAGVALEMTSASDVETISSKLESLTSGGGTAGAAGLRTAYDMISSGDEGDRIGRVILATDGDFNVGMSSPEEMKDFISEKRETGAYLSVLGFGQGNYNDALMQALAQNGNGQAAYIDTLFEARKVMQDQVTGALFPIANDVKIQVEFNPDQIAEYRLIGYETRALAREDFNDDTVDAGEIGAGHSVTAIYEVTPVGSPALRNDPLRYGADDALPVSSYELGFLKLRYKLPGEDKSSLLSTPIEIEATAPTQDQSFATAIAGFGQMLKDDTYLGEWSISDAITLAGSAEGDDPWGYRREAVSLMQLFESLEKLK